MVKTENEVIIRAEGPMVSGKTFLLEKIKELLIADGFEGEMEVLRPIRHPFDDCSLKITWTVNTKEKGSQ